MVSQDSNNENICLVARNMVVAVKEIGQPQWPSVTPGDICHFER